MTISTGGDPPATSARTVFSGRVKAIRSDGIMVEVIAELRGGAEVCVLITARGPERMQLIVENNAWLVLDTSTVVLSLASDGPFSQEASS